MKFVNLHDLIFIFVVAYAGVWVINHLLRSINMGDYTA